MRATTGKSLMTQLTTRREGEGSHVPRRNTPPSAVCVRAIGRAALAGIGMAGRRPAPHARSAERHA